MTALTMSWWTPFSSMSEAELNLTLLERRFSDMAATAVECERNKLGQGGRKGGGTGGKDLWRVKDLL